MIAVLTHLAAFYAGGAFVALCTVGGDWRNKVASALLWPTFPLWPL